MKRLAMIMLLLFMQIYSRGQVVPTVISLKTYGVKINVTDMRKALNFYQGILNFSLSDIDADSSMAFLTPAIGSEKIILKKVGYLLPLKDNEACASLTLQVNNLDSTIMYLKSSGVDFGKYQVRKEGVGYAIYLDDPFGTRLSFMHETVVENPHFNEPRIYNYGFYIPDMDTAKSFYTNGLGFPIRSERYLPLDLPLNNTDKSFGFMLHTRDGVKAIHYNSADNEHIVVMFQTNNLNVLLRELPKKNVSVKKQIESTKIGRIASVYDPFGYISQIVEIK